MEKVVSAALGEFALKDTITAVTTITTTTKILTIIVAIITAALKRIIIM
jgi:hypothetical protein